MALLIDTTVRLLEPVAGGFAVTRPELPYIERYGYTWIQPPDGLYYGPAFPGEENQLVLLEERGTLGHSSVRRGEYRYFPPHPEANDA
jgi:hypothetical protein